MQFASPEGRLIFSNESAPELGITEKEIPDASVDESHPDCIVGFVGIVQREMRPVEAVGESVN